MNITNTQTEAQKTKDYLIKNIEQFLTDEQIEMLSNIANGKLGKRNMMEMLFHPDELRNIDSAYPQGYQNDLIKVIGGPNCPNFIYNYNVDKEPRQEYQDYDRRLQNIDRMFLSRLIALFC